MPTSPRSTKKKKKTDYEALTSAFMRIPKMSVEVARYLIDLGYREIYELQGRCPESLLADIRRKKTDLHPQALAYLRLAVYFAETPDPEASRLHPTCWQ